MVRKLGMTLCAICVFAPFATQAAEVVVHPDEPYTTSRIDRTDRRVLPTDGAILEQREGPAVYGWAFRPPNCGVFHYSNGDECVDARVVPPEQ
jgi:hypothetical protein